MTTNDLSCLSSDCSVKQILVKSSLSCPGLCTAPAAITPGCRSSGASDSFNVENKHKTDMSDSRLEEEEIDMREGEKEKTWAWDCEGYHTRHT